MRYLVSLSMFPGDEGLYHFFFGGKVKERRRSFFFSFFITGWHYQPIQGRKYISIFFFSFRILSDKKRYTSRQQQQHAS
jgi:hypothetical protein